MENIIYKSIDKIEYDFLVADEVLRDLYKEIFPEDTYFVQAGEACKTFDFIESLIGQMQSRGLDRSSHIGVVGGGSLSDAVGFAAGIYMRGLSHDIIPTTLLSMVDACVGGKTAINFNHAKNFVGIFNEAKNVIIDERFTKTENLDNYKNGVVEAIKLAALFDENIFNEMEALIDYEMKNRDEFTHLAARYCPKKKQGIVKNDFRDKGLRQLLNAGHTIGHAIEAYEDYKIAHGKAVAIGLVIEHEALSYDTYKDFLRIFDKLYGDDFKNLVEKYKKTKLTIKDDKKSAGDLINIPCIRKISCGSILTLNKKDFQRSLYFE